MSGHRGAGPRDAVLFGPEALPALRDAVSDLSWLLSRGYADRSALKLVGDRHALTERQRMAVSRSSCSDVARMERRARRIELSALRGRELQVDGFNVLIACESILGGAPVLIGRDGAHRDLGSVHGAWRRVSETAEAVERVGALLAEVAPREVVVWLDRPVSNSGRLAKLLRERASEHGWPWRVELTWNADRTVMEAGEIAASGDARILDGAALWVDLPGALAETVRGRAWIIDLGLGASDQTK